MWFLVIEIILKEEPLVSAPNPLSDKICLGCSTVSDKYFLCPECRCPLCSADCPLLAEHQYECRVLSKIKQCAADKKRQGEEVRLNLLMLPLRCLLLRLRHPQKWQQLMNLESHVEKRRGTPIWNAVQEKIAPYLQMVTHPTVV